CSTAPRSARRRSPIVAQSASRRRTAPALSRSRGSLAILNTASRRKPSTPRSNQKRSTSCIAVSTSGLSQLRSGCCGRNECRYHWLVLWSKVQAPPAARKHESQSFGGPPSGVLSRQTYQSRLGSRRLEREATNHGCLLEEGL